MLNEEILRNIFLMLLCYAYILLVILLTSKIYRIFNVSIKVSRKILHSLIGNLPFVIPFFTLNIYPVLVAAPFIAVTFFASPYSPFLNFAKRLKGLTNITEEGHKSGLIFYAVSYTILALAFASKPYIIAAGILPMAYGDASASVIGERYGTRKYKIFANKTLEGSVSMFIASFLSLSIGLLFFSALYHFSIFDKMFATIATAIVATLAESISPSGLDNLIVPLSSALTFTALSGGI